MNLRTLLACGIVLAHAARLLAGAPPDGKSGKKSPADKAPSNPADAVVKVHVSMRFHDITRPWTKGTTRDSHGTGIVIEGKRILTNAHVVSNASEVYVQGSTDDQKYEAKIVAVSGDVDLALLSVDDAGFFAKRPPLPRADKLPKVPESVAVYGYPVEGAGLSITKGELARIAFNHYGTRGMGMVYQITAAVNPGNSGGPAIAGGKMIGVVFSRSAQLQQIGSVIPNEEVELFLDDCKDGRCDGKLIEATGTLYQKLENDSLRRMVGVGPSVKGILVRPPTWRGAAYPLQEGDVITKIGDYALDNTGMASIEGGLRAPCLYLMDRLAQTRKVPLTVWRKGQTIRVELPASREDQRLLRSRFGAAPRYFIHGPLIFLAASSDDTLRLAQLNPTLYQDNSPLVNRALENVAFPGEELVVVGAPFLPHKIAKGYGNPAGRTIKEVNGVRIKNLRHLVETLRDASGEFIRVDFVDDWSETLAFDREGLEASTAEILEDHGILPARRGSPDLVTLWRQRKQR